MIQSQWATKFTLTGELDMENRKPRSTGRKPDGYVTPVPNRKVAEKLNIRRMRKPVPTNPKIPDSAFRMPGSMNPGKMV